MLDTVSNDGEDRYLSLRVPTPFVYTTKGMLSHTQHGRKVSERGLDSFGRCLVRDRG